MDRKFSSDSPISGVTRGGKFADLVKSPIAVASGLCFIALAVRIYFAMCHPDFNNIFAVRGEPYSDGFTWASAGAWFAQGEGLGSVYRPGFSILLALFYVWFGYSAFFITASQVVIGALTTFFIYLVGERTLNRWIALAGACFFIFDPSQLTQTPQSTTEPLGLLFFVASIYFLLLRGPKRQLSVVFVSGLLLALSNLTRPLTLFCVPFYVIQLTYDEWRHSRKLVRACLPAVIFCSGIMLFMSPWLVRQRLVHGVWAVSTNLGEALFGATSPKYGTWTSLVRADADRAGVAPTLAARYRFFVSESFQNIRRYPSFYAGEVAHSYWEFLNCFHPRARAHSRTFSFPQWTGLSEGQNLFVVFLGCWLLGPAAWWWIRAESLRAALFVCVAALLLLLWWQIPASGFFILGLGFGVGFYRFRWENISLLMWSIVGAGIGDALFNNAILYRAVLMTDWIYCFCYFLAFSFLASASVNLLLGQPSERFLQDAAGEREVVPGVEPKAVGQRLRRFWTRATFIFSLFVLAGSLKLAFLNFAQKTQTVPRLTEGDKKQVVRRLRAISPVMRKSLPDPNDKALTFVEPQPGNIQDAIAKKRPVATLVEQNFERRKEVVLRYERLIPIAYYFPKGTDFAVRDRIFAKRPFSASVLRTARSMTVFPGKIPPALLGRPAILVGWIEGPHPSGSWLGQVMQCAAIVPVTPTGKLDYRHAVIASPQAAGVL